MKLYYTKPADRWEETLPIGNGSLGAMVFGAAEREHLGLNEESLWSGYYKDKNNPEAAQHLDEVRRLIESGRHGQAEQLIQEHMLGEFNESYLPLGDLYFAFDHGSPVTAYRRELDIENAVAAICYQAGGCQYRREYFASYPAKAVLIRFTCDKPTLNFAVTFESQLVCATDCSHQAISISGKCPEHVDPSYIADSVQPVVQGSRGMAFTAELRVLRCDGEQSSRDGALVVRNATEAVMAFSAVRAPAFDPAMSYEQIRDIHIQDYRSLYGKVELYLGEQVDRPTDERLQALREGARDNGLYALYFQYGRYLLISSSREGSLPANLQGIWSWELRAPWSCNWTTNINTQMNYWPAQSCNLPECLPPYFEFLKRLCQEGKKTARIHYNCRGFTHHHNADYWCNTNPVGRLPGAARGRDGSATWAMWPMGGAWLVSELFRHYEYNMDKAFLCDTAYPILREAALFLVDWLYEHDGVYVTCPSTSPENRFYTKDGETAPAAMSSAMDLALVREVFGSFRQACQVLEIDDPILPDIARRLERLAPFQVGSRGQLLEWNEEFDEPEPGHRHLSHLYGLFPSELFEGDERLLEACRASLLWRLANGGGHTGWSCAWIINLFATLGDGEKAYEYLRTLLTRSSYDNLWDAHPPFQIDGNFGGTAGIANMLVQDRGGRVKLLPALPKEFDCGYVRGLRIKGGKTVDIRWKDGQLVEHRVH